MEAKIYKRTQAKVRCAACKKIFTKAASEVTRNKKLSRKNYCSQRCCGLASHKHLLNADGTSPYAFKKGHVPAPRKKDKYTPFKVYIKNIKNRKCNHEKALTIEYLHDLWYKQKGTCPYSGIKLTHAKWLGQSDLTYTASIDRIDSSKGYVPGNVQYVSMAINFMKNKMTHEETITLCEILGKKWA